MLQLLQKILLFAALVTAIPTPNELRSQDRNLTTIPKEESPELVRYISVTGYVGSGCNGEETGYGTGYIGSSTAQFSAGQGINTASCDIGDDCGDNYCATAYWQYIFSRGIATISRSDYVGSQCWVPSWIGTWYWTANFYCTSC